MTSAWDSEFSFQSQSSGDGEGTFVDFLPTCLGSGGIFSKPTFEDFRTLVDKANDWLSSHPEWEIKTCETAEFKLSNNQVDLEKTIYLQYGKRCIYQVRGLRLWLNARKSREEKIQKFGYMNLVPGIVEHGGVFSSPTFETLDDVVTRFNTMIRNQPLPGRIITIESQEMKMKTEEEVQPDKTYWIETDRLGERFLFIVRIFYEMSDEVCCEEIGFADFAPDIIEAGGIFTYPKYEPFSNTVKKVSDWCVHQQSIRICNIKSLDIKMKSGGVADSKKMNYLEQGRMYVRFLRIIRVAFTKTLTITEDYMTGITCKTIVPVQLEKSICSRKYESLTETRNRIFAWLKATGARVISAETSALRLDTGGERKEGPEASFTYNPGERDEYFIYVFRLYLSGRYQDPPPGMLPPVPELIEQQCCVIC